MYNCIPLSYVYNLDETYVQCPMQYENAIHFKTKCWGSKISNNILKACKNFIGEPISYLCNRSMHEGIFPDRLKYATIVPIDKKVIKTWNQITDLFPY
jgi:hypothetical protein